MVSELKILLASSSPRRVELVKELGYPFEVENPTAEEDTVTVDSIKRVRNNSERKARSLGNRPGYLIIGADTVVVLGGEIFGKPSDQREAEDMLRQLSGRTHSVITGVSIIDSDLGLSKTGHEETRVWFRELDERTIKSYVETGEPLDKAGAYGIQGIGGDLVERIEGSHSNVVGLPLELVSEMLRSFTG